MELTQEVDEATENTEPVSDLADALVNAGIKKAARESGRPVEEQEKRMGDSYEYMGVEQNPHQKQLDDYELTGDFVEVRR